ncbi:aldo/keto reductase [Paraphaeosphaeria sporulosa]
MSRIQLASGHEMPPWGSDYGRFPSPQVATNTRQAIKFGYRIFDGAYDYQNEKEAGEGIHRAIKDRLVNREDILVITKPWNSYHSEEYALPMMTAQNEAWGLDTLGWRMEDGKTTWEQLEAAVDQGIAKSIGMSNFQAQFLYEVQTYVKHPIYSLQIEHHSYLVQEELVRMAQTHNIAITAYSSFVKSIASKHNKTPAQVLLRWSTQRNIAVMLKSKNQSPLAQNLDATSFDLSQAELDSISALDKGLRFNDLGHYLPSHPLHIFAQAFSNIEPLPNMLFVKL